MDNNLYHICYCVDEVYFKYFIVSLTSLVLNNAGNIKIHLFYNCLTKKNKEILLKIQQQYKVDILSYKLEDDQFDKFPLTSIFTPAAYYRLVIPNLLSRKIAKALYLDSDIIVGGNILDVFKIDLKKNYLAAVEDPNFVRHKELMMRLTSSYFNSGVMLINLNRWREDSVTEKTIDFALKNPERLKFVDQCALNSIVDGNWGSFKPTYNLQSVFFTDDLKYNTFSKKDLIEAKNNPKIIHYTGSSKPWDFKNLHPYKSLYWRYLLKSPYRNLKNYLYSVLVLFFSKIFRFIVNHEKLCSVLIKINQKVHGMINFFRKSINRKE